MLKATAGGGGRGIRVVASDADLADAYERTRDEAQRAFGSGVVFLERLVTGARHVEVQVIADGQGTAWALGVRDCSVQRRNQKVIEESASPVLGPEQVEELQDVAPSGWPSRSTTPAPARSSSSTTPARSSSPSSRSTPGCRSSTRSPRSPPTLDLVKLADPRRRRRPPRRATRPGGARARRRGPAQRRGPRPRLRALPRAASRCSTCPPGRASGWTPASARATSIPADFDSMIAKIIALRPRPRRGAGPAAPGDARDHRRHRGRLDQQELRARPARPARGDRRQRRHRLDRPGPRRGPAGRAPALRGRAGGRRDRGVRGRGGARARAPDRDRPRRPPAGPARRGPADRPQAARHGIQGDGVAHRSAHRFRVVDPATAATSTPSTPRSTASTRTRAGSPSSGSTHRLVTATHGPIHLVEVDGVTHRVSRDEGGVCARPPPPWSWPPRPRSAPRSRPARRCWCWSR